MRVNWLMPTDERDYDRVPASIWIRGLQLFPYLEALGIENLVNAGPDAAPVAVVLRWQDGRALAAAQAVKRCGGKVVFDLCANYFEPSGLIDGSYGSMPEQSEEAKAMAGVSDVITAASRRIAEGARRFHPAVEEVPDSIDFRHFANVREAPVAGERRWRAVWAGVGAKARELMPILGMLVRNRYAITVITDRDPLRKWSWEWFAARVLLGYRFVPWSYKTFPNSILGGDVCVAPRDLDVVYNQGHSFFKIGVFMAEGVPAIASPVPSYVDLMGDGRGGWLCADRESWNRVLARLRRAPSEWLVKSREAREVMRKHGTDAISRRYADIFRCLKEKAC